ncbi:unnamed protein product [Cladocopium goreaui]|uniref:C3H1-type domain-containing protein n=1 Tax=Cladocopium goreaui TaxID=2562237 RepID=A0A9P1D824_9DINO|nr:unnamed protein product [Cladocopium goreaui]
MGQVCIAMLNYQRASLISVAEGLNHQPWPYFRGKHAPHAAPLPTGTADDRSICRHFLEKKCTFGDLCRFSHEVTALTAPPGSKHEDDRSICRHFLEGKCNYGDLCRFGHEVHELLAPVPVQAVSQDSTMRGDDRSICRHFLAGKCNCGDLCRFSHEVHELLAPVPVQAVSQDSTMRGDGRSICRHFLEGKCNYGDLCRFSHEVHELLAPVPVQAVSQDSTMRGDDRSICRHFLEGKCNYGDQCRFSHGQESSLLAGPMTVDDRSFPCRHQTVPQGAPSNLDDRPQCRHFLEGRCTYGDMCRFRHGGESCAAPALPAAFAAQHRAAPAPMRPQPMDDRPICRHFLESKCTYGDHCRFSHSKGCSA